MLWNGSGVIGEMAKKLSPFSNENNQNFQEFSVFSISTTCWHVRYLKRKLIDRKNMSHFIFVLFHSRWNGTSVALRLFARNEDFTFVWFLRKKIIRNWNQQNTESFKSPLSTFSFLSSLASSLAFKPSNGGPKVGRGINRPHPLWKIQSTMLQLNSTEITHFLVCNWPLFQTIAPRTIVVTAIPCTFMPTMKKNHDEVNDNNRKFWEKFWKKKCQSANWWYLQKYWNQLHGDVFWQR